MLARTLPLLLAMLVTLLPAAAARADDVAKGEELARALCAECHLNPAQGEKRGRMGVPGFAAIANRPLQTMDGVVGWLQSVPPMMPNHHLTQDEMYALAAYIMSLRKAPREESGKAGNSFTRAFSPTPNPSPPGGGE